MRHAFEKKTGENSDINRHKIHCQGRHFGNWSLTILEITSGCVVMLAVDSGETQLASQFYTIPSPREEANHHRRPSPHHHRQCWGQAWSCGECGQQTGWARPGWNLCGVSVTWKHPITTRPICYLSALNVGKLTSSKPKKPEVSRDVSKSNQIKSFTVLSDLSADAFFFNSAMMECFGFTSMVFLETM